MAKEQHVTSTSPTNSVVGILGNRDAIEGKSGANRGGSSGNWASEAISRCSNVGIRSGNTVRRVVSDTSIRISTISTVGAISTVSRIAVGTGPRALNDQIFFDLLATAGLLSLGSSLAAATGIFASGLTSSGVLMVALVMVVVSAVQALELETGRALGVGMSEVHQLHGLGSGIDLGMGKHF